MRVIIVVQKANHFSPILPLNDQSFVDILLCKIEGGRNFFNLAELALQGACFEEGTGGGLGTAFHFIN